MAEYKAGQVIECIHNYKHGLFLTLPLEIRRVVPEIGEPKELLTIHTSGQLYKVNLESKRIEIRKIGAIRVFFGRYFGNSYNFPKEPSINPRTRRVLETIILE